LLTGNTVVLKPSNSGALMAFDFYEVMKEAGLPAEALHVISGRGSVVGDHLTHHDGVDGITFTGSYDVGMGIYRTANESRPKPVVAEMGGKNPVIVTASADIDTAVEGVTRAAFGLSGQKCSATSRVYVEESVYDDFVDRLVKRASEITVGDPTKSENWMGPVIDQGAVARYQRAIDEVEAGGGEVLYGGSVLTDGEYARGNFVEPTIAAPAEDSWVWREELFLPVVAVAPVSGLDEGLERSNDTIFGLTAGLFSRDEQEIEKWFARIEAGTTYVNRAAGATTGAWPDIQSFGGWKSSGTSGAGGGGPWYLRPYMRGQSRTLLRGCGSGLQSDLQAVGPADVDGLSGSRRLDADVGEVRPPALGVLHPEDQPFRPPPVALDQFDLLTGGGLQDHRVGRVGRAHLLEAELLAEELQGRLERADTHGEPAHGDTARGAH